MLRVPAVLLCLAAFAGCTRGVAVVRPQPAPELVPGGLVEGTPERFRAVLDSWRGQPVVVNLWASWCIPCAEEMPRLVDAAERYEGQVRFLGVDVNDGDDAARAFAKKYGVPFPNLTDPRGEIKNAQRVAGLPATLFFRPDGKLAFRHIGEIEADELEERIEEVLRLDG